jgi:hypothetical protein
MRVYVYRNLHRKCLSVRDVKTRRVIAYVDSISLKECKFKVSAKLRQRVILEKRKNVHAGVEGEWIKDSVTPDISRCKRIMYDPYKYESFVEDGSMAPFFRSENAFVTIYGAFVEEV